jgi:hypothetical protein
MSDSDVEKTKEMKEEIEREINQLIRRLNAGTIDRKKLDSGLRKVRNRVKRMPPHKH